MDVEQLLLRLNYVSTMENHLIQMQQTISQIENILKNELGLSNKEMYKQGEAARQQINRFAWYIGVERDTIHQKLREIKAHPSLV